MSFHKRLLKIQFQIDHKRLSDRVGILVALLLAISLPWYFLLYSPQAEMSAQMQMQIIALKTQTETLHRKYTNILALVKNQDTKKLLERFQLLQRQMQQLNQEITQFHHRYISDKNLAKLLNALLQDMGNVKIQNFTTFLKATSQVEAKDSKDQAKKTTAAKPEEPQKTVDVAYYTLSLKGDFWSIFRYLRRVENLKWQIFWTKMDYQVGVYPEAVATIDFYTLRPALILVDPGRKAG